MHRALACAHRCRVLEVQQFPAALDHFAQGSQLSRLQGFATDGQDPPDGSDGQTAESEASMGEEAPEKWTRPRRLTRQDKGSWREGTEILDGVVETAPIWPENVPVFDPQSQMPWLFDTASPLVETYKILRKEEPDLFHQLLNQPPQTEEGPWPGANKILEWEVNVVFDSNPRTGEVHPMNKKVKCRVYLKDLQKEFKLSDDGIQYIAMICGPRYNPNKGLLTLTSEKYRQREDNRHHIVQMLTDLIAEGKRAYPEQRMDGKRLKRQSV